VDSLRTTGNFYCKVSPCVSTTPYGYWESGGMGSCVLILDIGCKEVVKFALRLLYSGTTNFLYLEKTGG
jgi:hypothetical protein